MLTKRVGGTVALRQVHTHTRTRAPLSLLCISSLHVHCTVPPGLIWFSSGAALSISENIPHPTCLARSLYSEAAALALSTPSRVRPASCGRVWQSK